MTEWACGNDNGQREFSSGNVTSITLVKQGGRNGAQFYGVVDCLCDEFRMTGNRDGTERAEILRPDEAARVRGLKVFELDHYGIVNMQFILDDGDGEKGFEYRSRVESTKDVIFRY